MTDPAAVDSVPPLPPEEEEAYREGLAIRRAAREREGGWVERALEAVLHAPHPFPRGEARLALREAPPESVVPLLLDRLDAPDRRVRRRAMTVLPRLDAGVLGRAVDAWRPGASPRARRACCIVLGAAGSAAAGGEHRTTGDACPIEVALRALAHDADERVRRQARRAVTRRATRRHAGPAARESAVRPFGLSGPAGEPPARPRSFAVAAHRVRYDANLGVLIRTAEAAGAESFWIVGRDFYHRPAAMGTDAWLPIRVIDTPGRCLDRARDEGFAVVAVQQGPRARPIHDVSWPDRPLLVVGSEDEGLPEPFLAAAALQVAIPVHGRIDSLNAAVAGSIAMYAFLGDRARRARPNADAGSGEAPRAR